MSPSDSAPRAWVADDLRRDQSWIIRLGLAEVAGIERALAHARRTGKDFLSMDRADFPLDQEAGAAIASALATTQRRWGICLLKGLPVDSWTEGDTRLAAWGIGLHMGVARPQNQVSNYITDVRDEGYSYKVKGGRGYNTNAGLDFHQDSCDVVALLCRRAAMSGGTSLVVSSIALRDEVQRSRPDLIPVLLRPFFHSYQGMQDPSQPPYYQCPILGSDPRHFAMRTNRKNTDAAHRDFPELPPMGAQQIEALDLLDELMLSDKLCYSMTLERGDMQLLNNYVALHSRTPFTDFQNADQKRHLLRLWLAIPGSQPLPSDWEEYFGDVRSGAVRGGLRGSFITPEFLAYERRQAEALGMHYRPWQPPKVPASMQSRLAEAGQATTRRP